MNKKVFKAVLLTALMIFAINIDKPYLAKADNANTATLRIMATGDLHGQVTALNTETGLPFQSAGLSKIATLVQQKKNEAGANNTLLLDAGDFLYDYTSNFFYDNYRDLTQPIMKAMSLMGYDYITLGNHEFDYPWDYLYHQLSSSGLLNKTVVSNTLWHDSGKTVFAPSAVITKALTAANGETVNVKIGIVGSTTNSISARRGDYVNYIDAANAYDSIVSEANRLKSAEKADIVIVLLHGGIGTQSLNKSSENVGYALTKVASIDAIITAHTHDVFPDSDSAYNSYSNVSSSTGCINGKPVIAASSHAQALGTIDLKLSIAADKTVTVDSGKASIDRVTKNTAQDIQVTSMFSDYLNKIEAGADTAAYKISNGIAYSNYDTVLQDSNLYQLLNNAKIDYGQTYINEHLPAYKNIPVIACTRNVLDNNEPYISMKDTLSAGKISGVLSESSAARAGGYIQMFEITGKNLREWLEYSASMYATEGTTLKTILQSYVSKNKDVSALLQDAFIYNWKNQYVFDGVSYTIDLTKKARYTAGGKLISTFNKRITSLTYHGIAVTDTQKFILVTDSGSQNLSFMPSDGKDSIKAVKDNETGKNITLNYIKKLNAFGNISVKSDHNWSLKADKSYTFLLGVPKTIAGTVSKYSWNSGLAAETTSYSFFKGKLPAVSEKINIVVSQGRTEMNNTPVPVIISAASKYSIKEIKYLQGKISGITDTRWNGAAAVKGHTFSTSKNGIYTVLVKDSKGNCSLAYVTVDRYNTNILPSPELDRLTNRNTSFSGTATPNSTIHVTIGDNNYSSKVTDNGSFKLEIKPQKAFALISAYTEHNGMKSALVKASVRKTGPDAVQLNSLHVGETYLTGTADAYTNVYALIWTTVYVEKGQTEAYKKSDFYNPALKITETDITVNPITGTYQIKVPSIKSNMKVYVYSYDRFGTTSKPTIRIP